jgi:hypothetical protein
MPAVAKIIDLEDADKEDHNVSSALEVPWRVSFFASSSSPDADSKRRSGVCSDGTRFRRFGRCMALVASMVRTKRQILFTGSDSMTHSSKPSQVMTLSEERSGGFVYPGRRKERWL